MTCKDQISHHLIPRRGQGSGTNPTLCRCNMATLSPAAGRGISGPEEALGDKVLTRSLQSARVEPYTTVWANPSNPSQSVRVEPYAMSKANLLPALHNRQELNPTQWHGRPFLPSTSGKHLEPASGQPTTSFPASFPSLSYGPGQSNSHNRLASQNQGNKMYPASP